MAAPGVRGERSFRLGTIIDLRKFNNYYDIIVCLQISMKWDNNMLLWYVIRRVLVVPLNAEPKNVRVKFMFRTKEAALKTV